MLLDAYDVTADIRSREISRASSLVSVHPGVRVEMVARQREMGKDGGVVLDGRDIGTAVFPDAEVKFFLDANPGERAQRRLGELRAAGSDVSFDAIEQEVRERDYTDTHRAESPLVRAWDAIPLDTTKLGPEEVVERMLAAVRAREGKPVDLGRLAEAHRRSPRRYLEALRTGGLSAGLYRLRKGDGGRAAPARRGGGLPRPRGPGPLPDGRRGLRGGAGLPVHRAGPGRAPLPLGHRRPAPARLLRPAGGHGRRGAR